ncbi:MAG: DNA-binding protein [Thermoplasmatota archaeon]
MVNDPKAVTNALQEAEEAFSSYSRDSELEEGLDPSFQVKTQHHKACRLIKACRTLRSNNGYYTSVMEMSFAAIERSLEWYVLAQSNDQVGNFQTHRYAYDRAAELGLFSQSLCDDLYQIYRENRSAAYYRDTVATKEQADKLYHLAIAVHEFISNHLQASHECICGSD